MRIKLGLHNVEKFKAYHISMHHLNLGDTYNTSNIERIIGNGDKACIEKLAEKTRKAVIVRKRLDFPSRETCLFVCEHKDVEYWYNHIQKNRKIRLCIYELMLTGKLFGTYSDYLKYEKYWCPKEYLPRLEKEGLFEGEYKIIKECNILDFSQK